jgi:cell migration-inducing and hyaluronan-binding protein
MDKDSFVILQLPGFAQPASGTVQSSLAALREAKSTSYFKDGNTLWVKLVVEDATPKGPVVVQVGQLRAQANIAVSKQTAVATASLDEAGGRRQ